MNTIRNYYLGCPVWGYKDWVGNLFTADARPGDYLYQYSRVFNSVEGNNTFYGLPKKETVRRWQEAAHPEFRFCFKFPRTISHDSMLRFCDEELTRFFAVMEPLAGQIGLYFLQLSPAFGPEALPVLDDFLKNLPGDFRYAVEVRNEAFFDQGEGENRLNALLEGLSVDRALFDTGTLHNLETADPGLVAAQRKKPRMPARMTATGDYPMLRFVGHNRTEPNLPRLQELAVAVAKWIRAGKRPFVFLHSPDESYAPGLCRTFHQLLQAQLPGLDLGNVPEKYLPEEGAGGAQLSLFD